MARISDPKTAERQREQFQGILASIKDKITALTPKPEPKPEAKVGVPTRPPPYSQSSPTHQSGFSQPSSATLHLSALPAELRGPEAEARLGQALGEGVEQVHSWAADRSSCVVRFSERRHAELALKAQQVWGFAATWFDDIKPTPTTSSSLTGTSPPLATQTRHVDQRGQATATLSSVVWIEVPDHSDDDDEVASHETDNMESDSEGDPHHMEASKDPVAATC